MPHSHLLPASIRVIVRGWLNCNQILCLQPDAHVLIDSGHVRDADVTLQLLRQPQHLGSGKLVQVFNTHCHADHMGGNAVLQRAYGCQVTVPEGAVAQLTPWTTQSAAMAYFDQRAEAFDINGSIAVGESFEAGGLQWEALPAPGHDFDALMFWCRRERILITGDALWQNGMGIVLPAASPNPNILAAMGTLKTVEGLGPRLVIPGHGKPFVDVDAAVDRARGRLRAFAADPVKNARHVVKALLVFALLERGRMPVGELPDYLSTTPVHRDMNEGFIGEPYAALAGRTLDDLLAAGAVRLTDGCAEPTMTA